ncbi:MAG TPA: RNA polymerase sigma factor SigZ, partial [Ktedonobacteraceae bacterium]
MAITTERAWDAFHTRIEQFIFKYTQDEVVTEDILQDVFLKMHIHSAALRNEERLQSWLYQIARHAIYDYYRHQKYLVTLPDTFDLLEEPVQEEDVEQSLLPYLKYLVDQLPEPYREAIILTEYHGLTQRELAERLNLSVSGAKSRVQRAREKLKQMLLACCH